MRKMAKAQALFSKSVCPACNRTFGANVAEINREVEALLPNLVCRGCGTKGAQYSIVCDIPTLTCDPLVTCASCGGPY